MRGVNAPFAFTQTYGEINIPLANSSIPLGTISGPPFPAFSWEVIHLGHYDSAPELCPGLVKSTPNVKCNHEITLVVFI